MGHPLIPLVSSFFFQFLFFSSCFSKAVSPLHKLPTCVKTAIFSRTQSMALGHENNAGVSPSLSLSTASRVAVATAAAAAATVAVAAAAAPPVHGAPR